MKTIHQYIEEQIFSHGLFPDQIRAVMDKLKTSPSLESLGDRWNDLVEDCPPNFISLVWACAARVTYEWLQENAPLHWAVDLLAPYAGATGIPVIPSSEEV